MSSQENENLIRSCYEAMGQKDLPRLEAFLDDEVELDFVAFSQRVVGKKKVGEVMLGWFAAFPDMNLQVIQSVAGEEGGAAEIEGIGTHSGALFMPGKSFPATGRRVHLRGCEIFKIRSGKIVSVHTYVDGIGLMRQLGIPPGQLARAS